MAININEMKRRLEDKRRELELSLERIPLTHADVGDAATASEEYQNIEDAAVDAQEMQQEQAIIVNQRTQLNEVVAALQRIEDGTYGKSVVSGKAIPEKRLEVMPWASRCVEEEEVLDRELESRDELVSGNSGTHFS